jgi:hypothetical protein
VSGYIQVELIVEYGPEKRTESEAREIVERALAFAAGEGLAIPYVEEYES